jgi:L-ascorbate metabolism protein UlaG (beta-lactamase superfamily)
VAFSTPAAAERLRGNVRGLASWESTQLNGASGGGLTVTAVLALHGPPGSENLVGPVTGFMLSGDGLPTVYVSGDNASLELVREIAGRFVRVDMAILFAGGARTALLGDAYLTLSSAGAAEAARIIEAGDVVPIHFEGWAHFSQGVDTLQEAFTAVGLTEKLRLLAPGDRFERR